MPACLKFHNLIGSPDFFEEDLALAKARSCLPVVDKGKEEVLKATHRPTEPQSKYQTTKQILESKAYKDLVEFRKSL